MFHDTKSRINDAVLSFDIKVIVSATEGELTKGINPVEIAAALSKAVQELGERWRRDEIYLPEVMLAASGVKEAMDKLRKNLSSGQEILPVGIVVIGTVTGDIHTIGKDLAGMFLSLAGFDVHDLGVNVAPNQFVEEAIRANADIIAASALLTTTLGVQSDLIAFLERKGMRKRFKVMVGGGAVTKAWADRIGADGYGQDADEAVRVAKTLIVQE
jgi:methanogenic corrinoid protein MtbC1